MNEEKNFWVGAITGMMCSSVLFIISMFIINDKVNELRTTVMSMQEVQCEQRRIIEEDRKIMQTYKFFNESWQAIIDLRKVND